jgi:hypothetical protein
MSITSHEPSRSGPHHGLESAPLAADSRHAAAAGPSRLSINTHIYLCLGSSVRVSWQGTLEKRQRGNRVVKCLWN